ncbi:MAG: hypothetical protein KGQ37_10590 [Hyphomicrobiales bacterium]|nr:hypothetical protein [Hyphomicrobiales bacterium]
MTFEIHAFYRFFPLADPESARARLESLFLSHEIVGTFIVSTEGINATLAGTPAAMKLALAGIARICDLTGLQTHVSHAAFLPFRRLKVTIKPEIVTLRDARARPDRAVGTYVDAEAWHALLDDPETLVIDTRNHFEVGYGTFAGAIDPMTTSFSEFPAFVREKLGHAKGRKIAMFCTGGIRCEKATSLLLAEGFTDVYHLKGGILRYLDEVAPQQSRWQGTCFVFDERKALGHAANPAAPQHAGTGALPGADKAGSKKSA